MSNPATRLTTNEHRTEVSLRERIERLQRERDEAVALVQSAYELSGYRPETRADEWGEWIESAATMLRTREGGQDDT